ncbi:Methionyl-tRNA formyltransferase, mitochondrial [Daldinia childiae]|uniref:Methionyl-tRNA formyltransferase, mitochondrial n=1 Tax=Daldinia childiae TaxID=326645 RepID=UPI001447297B|nr:Methionyl-tRNA formyltransferase, mitochondrial [Daldinia childiae]KAF3058154.1 Methionyl-tRNA formyltransferase, mitochondrial [Daldinia childiae]
MPSHTNLIIAVSFGLFVPPRLLRAAQYGGLNVHPSLLPDLRGPAPLQHALLAGHTHTGISLQTLDDRAFDHGLILARTPPLPIPPDTNYAFTRLRNAHRRGVIGAGVEGRGTCPAARGGGGGGGPRP